MAEPKRHRDVPQGACFGEGHPIASSRILVYTDYTNKNATNRERWWRFLNRLAEPDQAASAIFTLIFFMAFFSSWRIRSAETPYLSANSCSVDLLSDNQRSRRMS